MKIIIEFTAGNLFGVSLSTLLLRDTQITSEENNIPLVFQKILSELTKRGVKEEGILRVGGHKQKVNKIKIFIFTSLSKFITNYIFFLGRNFVFRIGK